MVITYKRVKLIIFFFCLWGNSSISFSLPSAIIPLSSLKVGTLATSTGRQIQVYLAQTTAQQIQGLSYQKNLPDGQGMLFPSDRPSWRQFWMKDTYLPLDIYFLDGDFKILKIARNMPATPPGSVAEDKIANTGKVWSQMVLELKSTDPLGQLLVEGEQLKWTAVFAPY